MSRTGNHSVAVTALGLVLGFACRALLGQTFFGSIVGTVTDASGAAVPEASIALINTGTAERRNAQTDTAGVYRFVNLVPGAYRLEIQKAGFRRLTRDPIQVEVRRQCASMPPCRLEM
jgi:hypothetical protein